METELKPDIRRCLAGTVLLTAAAITLPGVVCAQDRPPQQVHRSDYQPIPDNVFELATQFYDYDPTYPLNSRIVDAWDDDSGRYEKVVFTSSTDDRIPGEIALPLHAEGPIPVVLLLHGLGNSKERWARDDRRSLRDSLLAAGIASFAIDLRYHGERSVENDYQPPMFLTFGDSLFIRNRNMIIQSAIDARRAIDFLRSRSEFDAERIGVVGYSMGGMIGIYLSALEPQLRAVVACAVPTTEQLTPTDHFHFASRAKVRTMLMIGSDDWLSSPEDIQLLHSMMPKGSQLVFYASGHSLPSEFGIEAALWLIEELPDRGP